MQSEITPFRDCFCRMALEHATTLSLPFRDQYFLIFILQLVSFSIPFAIMSLLTIGGNALVIMAFVLNKLLTKTLSNYFILSLAMADLLIGTISMNLFTINVVYGEWPLGHIACNFWLTVDYWASNASVLNLLLICLDRYILEVFSFISSIDHRSHVAKTHSPKMSIYSRHSPLYTGSPELVLHFQFI